MIEKKLLEQISGFKDQIDTVQKEMRVIENKYSDTLSIILKIDTVLQRNKKDVEELDGTLSCLSCLEYLKEPLTLICGHSICRGCFGQHGDTASKDSLVFCEECKIETKNKMLKE